ncbi:MAG: esterase [Actinomycetales bacterium]|nr:MAG: esterase [Actinomycetales bacterium]
MGAHLTLAAEPRYFRGTSLQSRLLGAGLRHSVRPILGAWARLPFDFFPPNLLEHAARLLPVHEGTSWRSVQLADSPAEWLMAKGVHDIHHGNRKAVLYFHGGAFLTCGLNTHRRLVSRISYAADQPVLNVGYRQMPHEPITESIADGVTGFRWLLDQGYAADDITIAGGVALSPLLDVGSERKAAHRNADRCQTFPLHALERFSKVSLRMDTRRGIDGTRLCPVDMPLADMPPALIQIGSHEILLADAEYMANRLVSAGVPCDLQVWDRQVHVFQAAASWVPEGRAAITEIGEFIEALAEQEQAAERRPQPARRRAAARTAAAAAGPVVGTVEA